MSENIINKELIFCTSFFKDEGEFNDRIIKWVNYYKDQTFFKDKIILIIDDGSNISDNIKSTFKEKNINYIEENENLNLNMGFNFYHFKENLGRPTHLQYWGWWRSFMLPSILNNIYNFKKIIHIESDFYITTNKIFEIIEDANSGWEVLWCTMYNFPETCCQIISPNMYEIYSKHNKPKGFFDDIHAELIIPFTKIIKEGYYGDRWGESKDNQPDNKHDYVAQVRNKTKIKFLLNDFNNNS